MENGTEIVVEATKINYDENFTILISGIEPNFKTVAVVPSSAVVTFDWSR